MTRSQELAARGSPETPISTGAMRIAMHRPIYNARILEMPNPRCCGRKLCLLILLSAVGASASQWQPAAEQLARKIVAVTGSEPVAVGLENRSTLSQADSDDVRRQLLAEMSALGTHFGSRDQATAVVQVTLSENQQSYVWIAEIHRGANEPSIVMVSVPRPSGAAAEHSMTIKKTLVWSDSNRILDLAFLNGNPPRMIVLEAGSIVLYTQQNGHWQLEQSSPIVSIRPWPRDLRGRLMLRKDHLFDAYLPGIFCRSSSNLPLAISCEPSDDPWPLALEPLNLSGFFASSRNFFTGVLSPGVQKQTAVAPFYSAAPLPRDSPLWVFSTTNGQWHVLDGVTDQTVGRVGLGSDIAAVKSPCDSGWQILATSNHDEDSDAVIAFEVPDHEPVAASQPVEFSGKITALWTEQDEDSAIAVMQNSESGSYEAYRLIVACGQ
jgi:hypothetical protein